VCSPWVKAVTTVTITRGILGISLTTTTTKKGRAMEKIHKETLRASERPRESERITEQEE